MRIEKATTLSGLKRQTASVIFRRNRINPVRPQQKQMSFDEDNNPSTSSGGSDATILEIAPHQSASLDQDNKNKNGLPIRFHRLHSSDKLPRNKISDISKKSSIQLVQADKNKNVNTFIFGNHSENDKKYLKQFKEYLKSKNA